MYAERTEQKRETKNRIQCGNKRTKNKDKGARTKDSPRLRAAGERHYPNRSPKWRKTFAEKGQVQKQETRNEKREVAVFFVQSTENVGSIAFSVFKYLHIGSKCYIFASSEFAWYADKPPVRQVVHAIPPLPKKQAFRGPYK